MNKFPRFKPYSLHPYTLSAMVRELMMHRHATLNPEAIDKILLDMDLIHYADRLDLGEKAEKRIWLELNRKLYKKYVLRIPEEINLSRQYSDFGENC